MTPIPRERVSLFVYRKPIPAIPREVLPINSMVTPSSFSRLNRSSIFSRGRAITSLTASDTSSGLHSRWMPSDFPNSEFTPSAIITASAYRSPSSRSVRTPIDPVPFGDQLGRHRRIDRQRPRLHRLIGEPLVKLDAQSRPAIGRLLIRFIAVTQGDRRLLPHQPDPLFDDPPFHRRFSSIYPEGCSSICFRYNTPPNKFLAPGNSPRSKSTTESPALAIV